MAPVVLGVAKDVSHIPTGVTCVGYGKEDIARALAGADVVVVPAGVPRKPGMTRADLFGINASIIATLTSAVAENCPGCLLAIVTNPVNTTVPIAAQVRAAACPVVSACGGAIHFQNGFRPFRCPRHRS